MSCFSLQFVKTLVKRNLLLAFLVGIFFSGEFILPVHVDAQSIDSYAGAFYFTGSTVPLRNPTLRGVLPRDGLKVGSAEVRPFLGLAEIFTDNVFATRGNRKSDFSTTIAPGLQVNLPFGVRHSFLFDYRLVQYLYHKFSGNNVLTQHGLGNLSLNFPSGLKINLQGDRIEGFDARGSEVDTQQGDVTKWNTTSFLGQGEIRGNNLGVQVRLLYIKRHYKNNGQKFFRDRDRIRARIALLIPVSRLTSGLLGFRVTNTTYDDNRQLDSFAYGVFAGFNLRKGELLSGDFNIGYTILNFDSAPIGEFTPQGTALMTAGLSLGGKQQQTLTMRGNIVWKPTSNLQIALQPFRQIQQSAVFNTSTFTQTGVSVFGRQRLSRRWAVRGLVSYSNNAFEEGRKDNLFRWIVGLDFKTLEWLGFRFDYSYAQRFSNQNTFDFYSNTISFSVQGII